MNKILIVEDKFELAEKLRISFSDGDNQAYSCTSVEEAEYLLQNEIFDIAVIDTELENGYDLIYELGLQLYKSSGIIIIAMLPNNRKPDAMELIEQGISDYITKPFSTAVLKAKVYTHLSKRKKDFTTEAGERFEATGSGLKMSISGEHRAVIDNYIFDFDNREYSLAGKRIKLNNFEQCILRTLVENKGVVLKKKAFLDKLSAESNSYIDEKLLADAVKLLTEKLEAYDYMKIIFGIGYMWASDKME